MSNCCLWNITNLQWGSSPRLTMPFLWMEALLALGSTWDSNMQRNCLNSLTTSSYCSWTALVATVQSMYSLNPQEDNLILCMYKLLFLEVSNSQLVQILQTSTRSTQWTYTHTNPNAMSPFSWVFLLSETVNIEQYIEGTLRQRIYSFFFHLNGLCSLLCWEKRLWPLALPLNEVMYLIPKESTQPQIGLCFLSTHTHNKYSLVLWVFHSLLCGVLSVLCFSFMHFCLVFHSCEYYPM